MAEPSVRHDQLGHRICPYPQCHLRGQPQRRVVEVCPCCSECGGCRLARVESDAVTNHLVLVRWSIELLNWTVAVQVGSRHYRRRLDQSHLGSRRCGGARSLDVLPVVRARRQHHQHDDKTEGHYRSECPLRNPDARAIAGAEQRARDSAAMRYSCLRLSRHAENAATRIPRTPATPGRHDASELAATTGLSSMGSSGGTPLRICRSAIRWLRRSQRSSQLIVAVSHTNQAAPSSSYALGGTIVCRSLRRLIVGA